MSKELTKKLSEEEREALQKNISKHTQDIHELLMKLSEDQPEDSSPLSAIKKQQAAQNYMIENLKKELKKQKKYTYRLFFITALALLSISLFNSWGSIIQAISS